MLKITLRNRYSYPYFRFGKIEAQRGKVIYAGSQVMPESLWAPRILFIPHTLNQYLILNDPQIQNPVDFFVILVTHRGHMFNHHCLS